MNSSYDSYLSHHQLLRSGVVTVAGVPVVAVAAVTCGKRTNLRAQLDNESWHPWLNHKFYDIMRTDRQLGLWDLHKRLRGYTTNLRARPP